MPKNTLETTGHGQGTSTARLKQYCSAVVLKLFEMVDRLGIFYHPVDQFCQGLTGFRPTSRNTAVV